MKPSLWAKILLWCSLVLCTAATSRAEVTEPEAGVPLVIGHRSIHTFRAPLGIFSPAERAEAAKKRIEQAFQHPGDGWTSITPSDQGIQVELDGAPLFMVVPGDAQVLAGETAEELANRASRLLQKAWSEARERRDPGANLAAMGKVALATVLLAIALILSAMGSFRLRVNLSRQLSKRLHAIGSRQVGKRLAVLLPLLVARLLILLTWLLGLFLGFVYLTYSFSQFPLTRPAGETLAHSITHLMIQAFAATAAAIPGAFISIMIFLLAWVATRISAELFAGVDATPSENAMLNTHTAPSTRRIVNTLIWLFAIAMAYPYLPGSHTEAFKGLSVIAGLMVSIGAAGVVGQMASGMMIVYTYALQKGEYVRIQDFEGTVTEIGLFVTRLRTGLGEEISLPNALVLANVTRNFSRPQGGRGYVLDTTVTIGYDTPWRQVHAMLLGACKKVPEVLQSPAPYVIQSALSDFYAAYKLVAHVDTEVPATRARVASDLHAAIQDVFNEHGVQIMSPHYALDPEAPKIVEKTNWYPPPADAGEAQSQTSEQGR